MQKMTRKATIGAVSLWNNRLAEVGWALGYEPEVDRVYVLPPRKGPRSQRTSVKAALRHNANELTLDPRARNSWPHFHELIGACK